MKQTKFYSTNSGMRFNISQEVEEDNESFCAAPNNKMYLKYTTSLEILN